jgi:hypothetical protein
LSYDALKFCCCGGGGDHLALVIISRTATVDDPLLYSAGASCAPDAKLNNAESDDFEIGWSDAYGIVEGDGEYTIHNIEC